MSWSRFWRMFLLVSVWTAALYVVSQSGVTLFRRRRMNTQKLVEPVSSSSTSVPLPVQEARNKGFRSPTMQRNTLLVVVAVLLLGVIGQALFALHVPIMNVFSFGKSTNADGATFIAQPPVATVTRTRAFETGIVTPQWQQQKAYGPQWQQSLSDIQTQTGSQWIELSLLFSQSTSASTTVRTT